MELGSEFNLNVLNLSITQNTIERYISDMKYCLFDSGRSALKFITPTLRDGYVLIPEYICESVLNCFDKNKIIFYRLKNNLEIDEIDLLNKIDANTAAVYIMHYFGSIQPKNTLELLKKEKQKYGFKIIEDTTHSLFSNKHTVGDFCISSLRKWFPIPNGGILYSDKSLELDNFKIEKSYYNRKAYAMILKTLYLNGQLDCNSKYREMFKECEKNFNSQKNIKKISDFSKFLLSCYDVYNLIKKRKSNFNILKNKLENTNIKQICSFNKNDCPFTIPIVVPERDNFRNYLIKNKIYCAVHWPFDGLKRNERPLAESLSNLIISLPIDQRYGEKEMDYMFNIICAYKGRLKL